MPYSKPPSKIKGLPKHAQDIWVAAFNSAFKQYNGDEGKANATAWSAVKKAGYSKSKDGKWSKMQNTAGSLDPSGTTTDKSFGGKKMNKKKGVKSKVDDEDVDEDSKMGKNQRGVRDGTGPFKDSFQRKTKGGKGKRQENGEKCPVKKGGKKMKKMAKFAKWTTAYKNKLPDSAFAVVLGSGDEKVRKLPFKDAEGKVDVPHLRNALVRVAQGKTALSPSQRAKARTKLMGYANKYLKSHKETKSGKVISKYMSKFKEEKADVPNRIKALIDVLKDKAANKKPNDELIFTVKKVALLIEDLEDIHELVKPAESEDKEDKEKKEEKEDEEKEEDKEKEKEDDKEEDKEKEKKEEKEGKSEKSKDKEEKTEKTEEKSDKEEDKKEDSEEEEQEESKFQEAMKIAKEYKKEAEKAMAQISKLSEELKKSKSELADLKKEISKFKEDSYEKILKDTVTRVSKFRNLTIEEAEALEKQYRTSKMSESALREISRITDREAISKLSEPKATTKPTNQLDPVEEQKAEFSKMSKEEQLEALANANAKKKGFVTY